MVECLTPEREVGVPNLPPPCCVLEQDTLLPISTKFLNVKLVLLSDTYLIIIYAMCPLLPFQKWTCLGAQHSMAKQPIADYVSNHICTC